MEQHLLTVIQLGVDWTSAELSLKHDKIIAHGSFKFSFVKEIEQL